MFVDARALVNTRQSWFTYQVWAAASRAVLAWAAANQAVLV